MGIKVVGPDPKPGLTQAGPNPPIPFVPPFPDGESGETLAIQTFNTGGASKVVLPDNKPIDGIIPGANTPIPAASTVPPARVMIPIPFNLMQDGSAIPGGGPPPIQL